MSRGGLSNLRFTRDISPEVPKLNSKSCESEANSPMLTRSYFGIQSTFYMDIPGHHMSTCSLSKKRYGHVFSDVAVSTIGTNEVVALDILGYLPVVNITDKLNVDKVQAIFLLERLEFGTHFDEASVLCELLAKHCFVTVLSKHGHITLKSKLGLKDHEKYELV
jgi:hypothetical protein